jgi:hypothetical protein
MTSLSVHASLVLHPCTLLPPPPISRQGSFPFSGTPSPHLSHQTTLALTRWILILYHTSPSSHCYRFALFAILTAIIIRAIICACQIYMYILYINKMKTGLLDWRARTVRNLCLPPSPSTQAQEEIKNTNSARARTEQYKEVPTNANDPVEASPGVSLQSG